MNWMTLLPLIIVSLPGIVQAIEAAADSNTKGSDKKAAVLGAVEQMATVAMGVDPNDTALIQLAVKMASPLIDTYVAVYNTIGKFAHKPATAQTAPAK